MSVFRFRLSLSRALGIAVVALLALPAHAAPPNRQDVGKGGFVEVGAKAMVARTAPIPVRVPAPKPIPVRAPVSAPIAKAASPGNSNAPPIAKPENPNNPTVAPGDVKWHASLAAACNAAKKSGKPVLLFHMLGQLDKQFC